MAQGLLGVGVMLHEQLGDCEWPDLSDSVRSLRLQCWGEGCGRSETQTVCCALLPTAHHVASRASDWLHNRGQVTPPLCILTVLLYRGNNIP